MRLTVDKETWHDPVKFTAWHNRFLDRRQKLGKLPRLIVDVTDEKLDYGTSRLGDHVTALFSDMFELSMKDSRAGNSLNQQLIQSIGIAVLRFIKKEMLVSDPEAYERITRILHEVGKIKPSDGMPALYAAYSKALLKI
jgi:hypothetical protein